MLPAEFRGQLAAIFDALLLAGSLNVQLNGLFGNQEVAGDLLDRPAVHEAHKDCLALESWGAVQSSRAGVLAARLIPLRFFDFVAVEQASAQMGDDLIPSAAVDAGGAIDAMTRPTREGAERFLETIDIGFGRVETEEVEEGVGGEGVIDRSHFFPAAGAEPAPAHQLHVIFVKLAGGRGASVDLSSEVRPPDDGLLEIIGDSIGEIFPKRSPELIGS